MSEPRFRDTEEGEAAFGTAQALERIADALETIAKCVERAPEVGHQLQIAINDTINVRER